MAYPVEARLDVRFQNPSRPVRASQQLMTLLQGVGTAAIWTEAVRITIRQGFLDGVQTQQVKGLHGPVGHRGNP